MVSLRTDVQRGKVVYRNSFPDILDTSSMTSGTSTAGTTGSGLPRRPRFRRNQNLVILYNLMDCLLNVYFRSLQYNKNTIYTTNVSIIISLGIRNKQIILNTFLLCTIRTLPYLNNMLYVYYLAIKTEVTLLVIFFLV